MKKGRCRRALLSRHTVNMLIICLSLIMFSLLMLLSDFLNDIRQFPSYAVSVYPEMFEYIMLSLAISVSGAFVMEYSLRELKR